MICFCRPPQTSLGEVVEGGELDHEVEEIKKATELSGPGRIVAILRETQSATVKTQRH
jgi:hypothetical protein